MTLRLITICTLLAATAACLAQDERPRRPRGGGAEAQPINRDQMRSNQFERRVRFLKRQLDLDEQQQQEFDEIVEKYKSEQGTDQNTQQVEDLIGQMREARKNGDNDRVKEIQAQLRELRGDRSMEPFFAEVEKILHEDQLEKLAEIRSRMESRGMGPRGPMAQLERLRGELELNEDQARQYDEMFNELRSKMSPGGEGGNQELVQQLMQAVQENNQERIEELREQINASRGDQENLVTEFLDNVEKILEPQQKRTLEEFRRQMQSSRRGGTLQLRDYFQYASRLDLDSQQKEALRALQRESRDAERETRRDQAATSQLTEEYVKKIRDMLTDEQCAKFDQWVTEQQSREDRRGGRDRGDRRGRGDRRAQRPDREGPPEPIEPDEPEDPDNP